MKEVISMIKQEDRIETRSTRASFPPAAGQFIYGKCWLDNFKQSLNFVNPSRHNNNIAFYLNRTRCLFNFVKIQQYYIWIETKALYNTKNYIKIMNFSVINDFPNP